MIQEKGKMKGKIVIGDVGTKLSKVQETGGCIYYVVMRVSIIMHGSAIFD